MVKPFCHCLKKDENPRLIGSEFKNASNKRANIVANATSL